MMPKLEMNCIENPQGVTFGTDSSINLTSGNMNAIGWTLNLQNVVADATTSTDYQNMISNITINGSDEYVDINGRSLFSVARDNGSLVVVEDLVTGLEPEIDTTVATHDISISGIIEMEMSVAELPVVSVLWAAEALWSETSGRTTVTGSMKFFQMFVRDEPDYRTFYRDDSELSIVTAGTRQQVLPIVPGANLDNIGIKCHSVIATGGGGVKYGFDDIDFWIKNGANKVMELNNSQMHSVGCWLQDNMAQTAETIHAPVGDVPSTPQVRYRFQNNTGATLDFNIYFQYSRAVVIE